MLLSEAFLHIREHVAGVHKTYESRDEECAERAAHPETVVTTQYEVDTGIAHPLAQRRKRCAKIR